MKKLILMTVGILMFTLSYGQVNFKWEKTDSIAKTKSQIYSDTKLFIAETWKSAKAVIQYDDKENGAIFIEGSIKKTAGKGNRIADYRYLYNVKFYMKEQKYRIVIENVRFELSDKGEEWTAEVANEYPGSWNCSLSEKQWTELMVFLKMDMRNIVSDYEEYIKTSSVTNDNW